MYNGHIKIKKRGEDYGSMVSIVKTMGKKYVWSYYSHNRLTHKSSVQGKYFSSSGWVSPGTQARASAEKAWTGNQSYFDVE